ncbi:MAG: hypothetical protein KKB50_10665 [Planctomycetes bacterium]|nr:hypothetical protein [Planctomycetota bacterium]
MKPGPKTIGESVQPRGLRCPKCGCAHLPVLYTRQKLDHVLRVRCCRNCGRRVATRERLS